MLGGGREDGEGAEAEQPWVKEISMKEKNERESKGMLYEVDGGSCRVLGVVQVARGGCSMATHGRRWCAVLWRGRTWLDCLV